jgi:ubiquinone/menaquinone biosynthesis C-methylase UbiE
LTRPGAMLSFGAKGKIRLMSSAQRIENDNKPWDPFAGEQPDRDAALRQYRDRAPIYDLELRVFEPIRRRAINRLWLRRGSTVIDVACGTGLSFEALRKQVGYKGHVIGIDQSAEMLARARERVEHNGWNNFTLIHSPIESAAIDATADAALFHFTHDVMRTRDAVRNVLRNVRPGGRVVASGLKWAPAWAMPVNVAVFYAAMRSVTTFEGLARPWNHLESILSGFKLETRQAGGVYIASGFVNHPALD